MKKILAFAAAVACAMSLSGCASAKSPATGVFLVDTTAPVTATDVDQPGTKRGEASLSSVLGLFATGDASIATAARNAGITKIKTVDYQTFKILGFYAKYTVVVTGD